MIVTGAGRPAAEHCQQHRAQPADTCGDESRHLVRADEVVPSSQHLCPQDETALQLAASDSSSVAYIDAAIRRNASASMASCSRSSATAWASGVRP